MEAEFIGFILAILIGISLELTEAEVLFSGSNTRLCDVGQSSISRGLFPSLSWEQPLWWVTFWSWQQELLCLLSRRSLWFSGRLTG